MKLLNYLFRFPVPRSQFVGVQKMLKQDRGLGEREQIAEDEVARRGGRGR